MSDRTGRILEAFSAAEREERAALVLYTTAGYPTTEDALDVLLSLARGGADVIELGVPFSDPLADGPTIQKSSFDAIENGVDLEWTLGLLARFREQDETPVVIFTYLNPLLEFGLDEFLREAAAAGADGVLLTDLPLGADPELEARFESSDLDLVRLIAPTTTESRAREIASHSQGFVYYISRTGVTGAREEVSETLESEVRALRAASGVPVAVGFGIARPEQAAQVAQVADGVIVGSAIVEAVGRGGARAAGELTRSLRGALGRKAIV